MTNRQRELKQLARKMSADELAEAVALLQAEMRTRGQVTPPLTKDWQNRLTR